MNTKRMMRWVIVLFLLASLPVMTAVMAQGQEPRWAPMRANQEPKEPAPIAYDVNDSQIPGEGNLYESEPNDDRYDANRMFLSDVMDGFIYFSDLGIGSSKPDVDYFKFHMPEKGYVLIDVDSRQFNPNFPLDMAVCLEDSGGHEIACNNDSDTSDPLLYYGLRAGDYFIRLNVLTAEGDYLLSLSSPLLISAATKGSVDGITFKPGDILAHADLNNGQEGWTMFFDASDVGIVKNVTNIASNGGDQILLGFNAIMTLPGVGTVTPWDIVVFDAEKFGPDTQGTFQWGLPGRDHGLTMAPEKIDAIDGFINGYDRCNGFPVSTVGVANLPGPFGPMKQDDEDVFCIVYNPNFGGWQNWDWFFDVDGKNDAPPSEPPPGDIPYWLFQEDVIGMAYNDNTDVMYLTILGNGNIYGSTMDQTDIFSISYPSYTEGSFVWRGPSHGWIYNIDAFEMGIE